MTTRHRAPRSTAAIPTREAIGGSGRARTHHLIPEFYLLRFAGDHGRVLVTDKWTGERKRIAPRVLVTERDYYTVQTVEGPSDEIERWLSSLEGATAEALRRIEAGAFPPKGEDLGILSTFLAFQMCRGRQFQAMVESMVQGTTELSSRMLASIPDAMRAAIYHSERRLASDEEIREHQEYLREALEDERVRTEVPRGYSIDLMVSTAPEVAKILAQRSWMLVEAPSPVFITGDVPLALWSEPFPDGRPIPVGAMTAREITFPMDSRRCILLGKPNEAPGQYRVRERTALMLNDRHYWYARRFTFQDPVVDFAFDETLERY